MSDFEDDNYDEEFSEGNIPNTKQDDKPSYLIDNNINQDDMQDNIEDYDNNEEEDNDDMQNIVDRHQMNMHIEKPNISDTDAIRMVETFNTIKTSTFELSSLSNIVIQEVQKLIELGKEKSDDISEVSKKYEESKNALAQTVKQLKDYLIDDNSVIGRLQELETKIQQNYLKFSKNMKALGDNHRSTINNSLDEINTRLDNISKGIDTEKLGKFINTELQTKINKIDITALKEVEETFKQLDNSFKQTAQLLNGEKGGKKGLYYSLSEQLENANIYINKYRKMVNKSMITATLLIGITTGVVFTYIFTTQQYANKLNNDIFQISRKNNNKIISIEQSNKAFKDFMIKNKFNYGDIGFGRFEKSNTPYFFYNPKKMITREFKGLIYVFKKQK